MGAVGDMIDRIHGLSKALYGMRDKLDPPAPVASGTPIADQPPPTVEKPKDEDVDEGKKILDNLKGQVDALDAAVKAKEEKDKAAMAGGGAASPKSEEHPHAGSGVGSTSTVKK
jgi:hypothetical protein